MWDSVAVEGKEDQDGTLVVRVLVFNPDWDEPLQIASIRSRPRDPDFLSALGCNLNHVAVQILPSLPRPKLPKRSKRFIVLPQHRNERT